MTLRDKSSCLTRSASSSRTVLRKSSSSASATPTASPNVGRGQRVRRRLFGGIGCNKTDGCRWVSNQLKLLDENETATLGYDFKNDCPIVNGNQDEYIFEAVDEREMPSFYHSKTSASLDRRARIAPPDVFRSARKASSSFVVIMQVHDSIAYNTRSHDIIAFGDSLKASQPSAAALKASLSQHSASRTACVELIKDKDSKSDPDASFNRKRTMKQQTLTEFLPVVRCKRRSLPDKKSGDIKCPESKNFSSNRSFRICKAQESSTDLIRSSGSIKASVRDIDNRRITRSMCA